MHILSHLSYPYILANGIAMILGKTIPLEYNLAIIAFSLFPDIDVAVDYLWQILKTGKYRLPPSHHAMPTHWPIVYIPLIALALITFEPFYLIAASCILVHLLMDTLYCNEGVMLFYPFSSKWYIFLSVNTKNKKGWAWNKAYKKLRISYVDKYAFLVLIIHSLFTFAL